MAEHPNATRIRSLFAAFRAGDVAAIEKVLDNPTCFVIRLEEPKAVEIHEFVWNLFEVDEFWS